MKRVRTSLFFVAVVGIAVISVTTSVYGAENLVVNGGFEVSEDTDGRWPLSYGDWHGDYSSIVGTTSGITPLEGSRMLQFRGCAWETRPSSANGCEVPQIVDVSQFASLIASGQATASASAYFNRVAGDTQTDTLLYITIYAYEGNPGSYPYQRGNGIYLDRVAGVVYSDSDPATWERCKAELLLPANTDFVTIQVTAYEDIYNDTSGTELDGHFADEVSLEIISEPVMLVGLEIVGPGEVAENFNAGYKAIAYYDNNSTRDVTNLALWVVEPNTAANIDENGVLRTQDIVKHQSATILASYTEGDVTFEAQKAIDILAICPTGTALQFDGVNDYVSVPDDASLNITGDITISAWVYCTQGGSYQAIVTKCVGGGGRNNPFDFRTETSAEPRLTLVRADASRHERVYSTKGLSLNNWHHVLVRVENKVPDFYVNGVITRKYADTTFTRTPTGNTNPLLIGRRGYGLYFNGTIDEVAIYNRALSAEEIVANMHTRLAGDEPNLVGYWDFDEGEGQIVYDLSGNGNDGQLGSTPEADSSDPAWVESDAPIGICSLYQSATMAVDRAVECKKALIEELLAALAQEWTAHEALEELLESGDYGDLDKGDIVTAKQKIHSATQHEGQQSIDALEKSIEKLKDALSALGYELDSLLNQPPNVTIMKPKDGAVFGASETIEIEANAWDIDGSIVKVEFFADGSKIGEDNDGTNGWKTNWYDHPVGTYNLTAKATDNDGAATNSPVVGITVLEVPLPGQASNPNPANGARWVGINANLSWTAGTNAVSHNVYFGTTSPPPFIHNQTATTFDPGRMTADIWYYWRIDEVNPSGTTTGTVWTFRTSSIPPM